TCTVYCRRPHPGSGRNSALHHGAFSAHRRCLEHTKHRLCHYKNWHRFCAYRTEALEVPQSYRAGLQVLCRLTTHPSLSRGYPSAQNTLISSHCVREREHRSEEHTSELQSRENLVCRLLL